MVSSASVLDTYLGFLDTSNSESVPLTEKDPLPTPRIDTVLETYRRKASGTDSSSGCVPGQADYETRLVQLEQQLTALLHRSKASPYKEGSRPFKRSGMGDRNDSSSSMEEGTSHFHTHTSSPSTLTERSKVKKSRPTRSQAVISSRHQKRSSSSGTKKPSHPRVSTPRQDQRTKEGLLQGSGVKGRGVREPHLQPDLGAERERRYKAEQAAEKLVEHVRALQAKLGDTQTKHELCVVNNSQLTTQLTAANEEAESLRVLVEDLKGRLEESKKEFDKFYGREAEHVNALRALEENCRKMEVEKVKERTELSARVEEAERRAGGYQREAELLTKSVRHLKGQLQQMQELLVAMEREHRTQLKRCRPVEDRELQELVSKQVDMEKAKMKALVDQYKERLSEQQKAYQSLEDEFRMALRIETGRFQELHRTYEQVSSEVESSRETAIAAVQKEQRANGMILELTALVKEQKGRITELNRSKQEAISQLKERATVLESEMTTKHKLEVKLQSLQEENGRLSSRLQAQESMVEGLREERQLWGKELAHQGAALAQDRGRMEAQIGALTEEVRTVREQLQREREALRIKEKQVDDQLHSIRELKQALADKEHEEQSFRLDWQREQQSLQLQLEQEQAESRDLQEQVAGLGERNDSLKEELAVCQNKLEQWRTKYNKLKGQWEEKVGVLGGLEESMRQLQESFSQREATLVEERERALKEARVCQQRLKTCDDAFREQLEAKQRSHDQHVTKLLAEKDKEIQLSQQKVASVEDEMREVLSDVAQEKRNMEAKFQKLLRAVQEVRLDTTD